LSGGGGGAGFRLLVTITAGNKGEGDKHSRRNEDCPTEERCFSH